MGHINKSSKSQKYGFLSFVMGARIFKSNSSVCQGAQIFRPIDFGLLTSQKCRGGYAKCTALRPARLCSLKLMATLPVAATLAVFASGIYFSHSAHAASYVNVSSGGSGETAGVVSLGKIKPSSSGSTATGNDTLTVHTDCSAGYKVYVSGQNGKTTNLTNQSAEDPSNPSSSDIISASSNTIASPNTLSSNTWGISGSSTDIENHLYAGLPAYSSATNASLVTKSDIEEESTVPIYYGVKADTTLNPGTYSGDVLYTVLMDTSCIPYTVEFSPNVEQSSESEITGEMTAQSILPNSATALTANAYEREGYTFLGWSTTPEGKTGNVTNGIGTADDIDYDNEAEVTNLTTSGSSITLYAIWEVAPTEYMQDFMCSRLSPNGETKTLVDKRDGQEYTVYRIPADNAATDVAGKCIMTKDLNLGAVASVEGSSSTIVANGTMTLSPEDSTFTAPSGSGESIAVPTSNVTVSSSYSSTDSYSNKYYVANGTGSYAGRGYYSWGAAMVACPKGWRLPTSDEYNNSGSWNSSTTGISKAVNNNINTIQSSPWSFVLGGNYYNGFSNAGSNGHYWSSTQSDSTYSYYLHLASSGGLVRSYNGKSYGFAVRCMADDYDNTMQDFDSSSLSEGETMKLKDKRDDAIYTVKKFSDGTVWMTSNLILGHDKGYALTSELTNIPDNDGGSISNNGTYYLPAAGRRGAFNSSTDSGTSTFDSSNDSQAQVQYRAAGSTGDQNSTGTLGQSTGYYNFYAATLGKSYYNGGTSAPSGYPSAGRDICPKGWQLPLGGSSTTKSWVSLDKALNGSSAGSNRTDTTARDRFLNDAGFLYSGNYYSSQLYNVGSYGYWWSSTVYSTNSNYSYSLSLGSSGRVYPQDNDYKYYGLAVRCVAQDSATITFNANGGIGEMGPQRIYENDATLKSNPFTRDGYAFIGWSEDASATTATYADSASASDLVSRGGTITLYAVWQKIDGDMQSFMCMDSTIASGQTKTLRDTRDGQLYTVYRIPTDNAATNVAGKCIMTKDLNLGAVASVEGSSSTIVANGTMTLSPEDSTFTTPSGSGESITVPTSSVSVTHGTPGSGDNNYANRQYRIDGTGNYAGRGYYTWGTAMVACPKGWRLPTQDELNNNDSNWNASATGISKAVNNSLSTLQSSPWSFVLGGNYGNGFYNADSYGNYWSSTQYDSTYSYRLYLHSSDGLRRLYSIKSYGFAVRCMADDATPVMQSTACSSLPEGETSTLVDSRDRQEYSVYRWPTTGTAGMDYPSGMAGYCTMTKDLSLGYVTGGSIAKDSNLTLTTTDSAGAGTITARPSGDGWSTTNDDTNLQYMNGPKSGSEAYSSHGYYSYGAAQKVCPKGWTLPTQTQYDNIAAFIGGDNSTGSTSIRNVPYNFIAGGRFDSGSWNFVGSSGLYWSATQSSSTNGYLLYFNSSRLYTSDSSKNGGRSVRCVSAPSSGCFTAGTQIQTTMSGDTKPIEDIKVGDEVVSYDPSNHEYYMTEVLSTVVHDGEERFTKLAKLILNNGAKLEMTLNHPILTTTGYKALQNEEYETLTKDDTIVTTTGEYGIADINIYDTEPTTVYNLTVKGRDGDTANGDTHSYIANGVVVHNVGTTGGGST